MGLPLHGDFQCDCSGCACSGSLQQAGGGCAKSCVPPETGPEAGEVKDSNNNNGGGGTSGGDSCDNKCGGSAGGCWCDSYCTGYGDCCSDFDDHCTVAGAAKSLVGNNNNDRGPSASAKSGDRDDSGSSDGRSVATDTSACPR